MKIRNTGVQSAAENQEIIIVREFDAPKEKVFHALTDPEICEAWGLSQAVVSMTAIGFPANEQQRPEYIGQSIELLNLPKRGHGALEKIMFEEIVPEKTTVTMVLLCESIAVCGGWMNSGIGDMMAASFIKLDQLLQKQ